MEKHNRQSTVEMCKTIHESIRELAEKFKTADRREVYVTPTSYLELIQTFQTLLAKKRKEIDLVRKRYDNCRAKRSAKKILRRCMCSKAQVLKW